MESRQVHTQHITLIDDSHKQLDLLEHKQNDFREGRQRQCGIIPSAAAIAREEGRKRKPKVIIKEKNPDL